MHSSQEVQQLTTVPELELFLLEHGEEVIDMLGQQVDRIEKNIKVRDGIMYSGTLLCWQKPFIIFVSTTSVKGTPLLGKRATLPAS